MTNWKIKLEILREEEENFNYYRDKLQRASIKACLILLLDTLNSISLNIHMIDTNEFFTNHKFS